MVADPTYSPSIQRVMIDFTFLPGGPLTQSFIWFRCDLWTERFKTIYWSVTEICQHVFWICWWMFSVSRVMVNLNAASWATGRLCFWPHGCHYSCRKMVNYDDVLYQTNRFSNTWRRRFVGQDLSWSFCDLNNNLITCAATWKCYVTEVWGWARLILVTVTVDALPVWSVLLTGTPARSSSKTTLSSPLRTARIRTTDPSGPHHSADCQHNRAMMNTDTHIMSHMFHKGVVHSLSLVCYNVVKFKIKIKR